MDLLRRIATRLADKHCVSVEAIESSDVFVRYQQMYDGDSLDAVECVLELEQLFGKQ